MHSTTRPLSFRVALAILSLDRVENRALVRAWLGANVIQTPNHKPQRQLFIRRRSLLSQKPDNEEDKREVADLILRAQERKKEENVAEITKLRREAMEYEEEISRLEMELEEMEKASSA